MFRCVVDSDVIPILIVTAPPWYASIPWYAAIPDLLFVLAVSVLLNI